MTYDSSPPAARVSLGSRIGMDLHGEPAAGQVPVPGTAAIILGWNEEHRPVIVVTADPAWLDAVESAIQVERARLIVQLASQVAS